MSTLHPHFLTTLDAPAIAAEGGERIGTTSAARRAYERLRPILRELLHALDEPACVCAQCDDPPVKAHLDAAFRGLLHAVNMLDTRP